MPTYEYVCNQCGEQFILVMSIREYETAKVTCPKCQAADVKQQLTEFIAKTSKKSF